LTAPALKVPLIETAALSEFGDLRDAAQFYDPEGMDRDHSYVPGYSELSRTAALQLAEAQKGLRAVQDVAFMPVRARWARNQKVSGAPDSAKVFGHDKKGYRVAIGKKVADGGDVGKPWLTSLPPGSEVNADGAIRNGDCILMVCDADQARKNEFNKRRITEERTRGAEGAFAQMVETARVMKGATPYTKTEPAPAPAKK
jgi:hypothetical protein